jgi:hypothetical protein
LLRVVTARLYQPPTGTPSPEAPITKAAHHSV